MGRPPSIKAAEVCKIVALHPEPVVAAKDVYEPMGLTQRGAQERLKNLTADGYLASKHVGSSATVYWLTDKGRSTLG